MIALWFTATLLAGSGLENRRADVSRPVAGIMVHMYHEIQQPMALLAKLAPAFRTGGKLGVEELDRPTEQHGTPPKLLACELSAAGYRLLSLKPLEGNIGYLAVFSPPTSGHPQAADAAKACHG